MFEGKIGKNPLTDIALDDIKIEVGPCKVNCMNYICKKILLKFIYLVIKVVNLIYMIYNEYF